MDPISWILCRNYKLFLHKLTFSAISKARPLSFTNHFIFMQFFRVILIATDNALRHSFITNSQYIILLSFLILGNWDSESPRLWDPTARKEKGNTVSWDRSAHPAMPRFLNRSVNLGVSLLSRSACLDIFPAHLQSHLFSRSLLITHPHHNLRVSHN